jgi:hypothetical protein
MDKQAQAFLEQLKLEKEEELKNELVDQVWEGQIEKAKLTAAKIKWYRDLKFDIRQKYVRDNSRRRT